jgi:hypothetical protein
MGEHRYRKDGDDDPENDYLIPPQGGKEPKTDREGMIVVGLLIFVTALVVFLTFMLSKKAGLW